MQIALWRFPLVSLHDAVLGLAGGCGVWRGEGGSHVTGVSACSITHYLQVTYSQHTQTNRQPTLTIDRQYAYVWVC